MMDKEKMKGDYERTRDVILSCKNEDQLRVAVKMFNQLNRLHDLPEQDLDKLENLIGLMRLKFRGGDITEERSMIGQEFHKAAQTSGVPELRSTVFSEDEEFKGGKADKMSPKDLAKKHNVDVSDIEKEIRVGTKIEMEHTDSKKQAREIAMDHIFESPDYYTDPNYGIIAIEDKLGENKKTIRISKSEMDKLHNGGKVSVDGIELSYRENIEEDLDSNRISRKIKNDFKTDYRKRKDPKFNIDRDKPNFDDLYIDLDSEEEIEEATGAMSSGSYVGSISGSPITRTFKKSEIPVSVSGLDKPIGKGYGYRKSVLEEEEELDESTTVGGVGGVYDTPGFPSSEFMGTKGKKGKAPVKKTQPNDILKNLGYRKVRVKERCKTFPYCNQSPEAIEFYNESRVIKTIKKDKLKIKR